MSRFVCDNCDRHVAKVYTSTSYATGETSQCAECRGDLEQFEIDEAEALCSDCGEREHEIVDTYEGGRQVCRACSEREAPRFVLRDQEAEAARGDYERDAARDRELEDGR